MVALTGIFIGALIVATLMTVLLLSQAEGRVGLVLEKLEIRKVFTYKAGLILTLLARLGFMRRSWLKFLLKLKKKEFRNLRRSQEYHNSSKKNHERIQSPDSSV
jgi:hypothetical protein